jgi:hypothetical protein
MTVAQEAARHTSSDPSLQSAAQQVEQLRRQIAEVTGKRQTVSPALLAQFAQAQKSFLTRKIEFEKQKRSGSGISVPPPAPTTPAAASPADSATRPVVAETSAAKPASATTPVPTTKSPSTARPATPETSPTGGSTKWIILILVAVAAGVVAWLFLR